jgi:ParB family chromosome partitioning protein
MSATKELPIAKSGSVDSNIVREIALDQIVASPNNPRRTINPTDLADLAASIREHGVNVPLLVRPSSLDAYYEIVCGHRRYAAADDVGLDSVPCIVRELTDEQAAELALIDNLQRVDVPAIEEADAFDELLRRLGSVAAVAAKVGKEQAYVAKRLKLCTLTIFSKDALREKLITIDHALLLARLAEMEQNAALKWCLDRNAGVKVAVADVLKKRLEDRKLPEDEDEDSTEQAATRVRWKHTWEPETVLRLKEHIECESGIPLDRAPWDLELDDLGVRPCSECEKNTRANTPLFGDLDTGVAICTDGACFKEKTASFVRIKARLSDGVQAPLRVSWKSTSTAPRFEKVDICKCAGGKNCKTGEGCRGVVKPEQIFKYGQWLDVGPKSKKCEHTLQAVTVDWSDAGQRGHMGREEKLRKPGEVIQVCVASDCKVHKKAYLGSSGANRSNNAYDPKVEAEKRAKAEAAAREESKLRLAIAAKALEGIKQIPAAALRQLALAGVPSWGGEEKAANALLPGLKKIIQTAKIDSTEFAKALAVVSLERIHCGDGDVSWSRKNFIESVKLLGYDASKAWDKPKAAAKPAVNKPAKKAAKKKGGRK